MLFKDYLNYALDGDDTYEMIEHMKDRNAAEAAFENFADAFIVECYSPGNKDWGSECDNVIFDYDELVDAYSKEVFSRFMRCPLEELIELQIYYPEMLESEPLNTRVDWKSYLLSQQLCGSLAEKPCSALVKV